MGFIVDDTKFPIVRCSIEGVLNDKEMQKWLAAQKRTLMLGRKFATIVDTSGVKEWTALNRAANTKFLKENEVALRNLVVGCGLVMTNSLMRGMATAMTWVIPFPHPIKYCDSLREAELYCERQLRSHGISYASYHPKTIIP